MTNNENDDKKVKENSPFTQTLFKALQDKRLTIYDKMVLTAIGSFADNITGECWPRRDQIAEVASMKDLQAVTKCTRKLIKYGYLVLLRKGNSSRANDYRVIRDNEEVDRLASNAPAIVPADIDEDSNVIPITRKKAPKKALKAPATKQEPNEVQSIFDCFVGHATEQGMTDINEHKNKEAIKKLLKNHSSAELKCVIPFILKAWIIDNEIDKSTVDIGILNSPSYNTNIFADYYHLVNHGFTNDDFENLYLQCEQKYDNVMDEVSCTKEKAFTDATNINKSQTMKMTRVLPTSLMDRYI